MSLAGNDRIDEGLIQPLPHLVDGGIYRHWPSEYARMRRNAQKGKYTDPGQPDRRHADSVSSCHARAAG